MTCFNIREDPTIQPKQNPYPLRFFDLQGEPRHQLQMEGHGATTI